jgi:predicted O-linked N-acetylglucosamine transferase (SPINDLY family)
MKPMAATTIHDALRAALQYHQAGRLAEAEALYRQILAAQPGNADAWHHLGLLAHQVGRHDVATEWIERAIAISPGNAMMHSNLGEVYRAQGRLGEAIASYQRALVLAPNFAEAYNNLGNALRRNGQAAEAVAAIREALRLKPDYVEALNNLGVALAAQGNHGEAMECYQRALACRPDLVQTHNNLGNALLAQGQAEAALGAFRRALDLKPDLAEAHSNMGEALRVLGRLDEAASACRRAIELKPDHAEAFNHLGGVLTDEGKYPEAIAIFRQALQVRPGFAEVYGNLGLALVRMGRFDEALEACAEALRLKPNNAEASYNMGLALIEQGRIEDALKAHRQAIECKPDEPAYQSTLISTLLYDPKANPQVVAEEQARWNRRFGDRAKASRRPLANDRNPHRRLRIGYVSPDFRDHVVGRNLRPLFRCHDKTQVEVICYSGVVRPDATTEEFQQHADQWRRTVGMTDEAVAEMIRQDAVDILVDLSQHTAGNRLPVFARQPAPVQVSFAGYPAATGVEAIGYRVSDRWLESEIGDRRSEIAWKSDSELRSSNSGLRAERVIFIDSFWCYDPSGADVPVNELPAGRNGRVTFGCVNHFCKVNEVVLTLWARVMRAVENSRLVLLSARGSHRQKTLDFLKQHGIAPDRVEFFELQPRRAYLELYHQLDLVLDTFPYGGHTTGLDALWMGVPVVSLAGEPSVSRASLSQLSNLGLSDLVAFSEDQFVEIATELAGDVSRLAELRATLRSRMESSVLMDPPHFARQIEAAYRAMWREWCAGGSLPLCRGGTSGQFTATYEPASSAGRLSFVGTALRAVGRPGRTHLYPTFRRQENRIRKNCEFCLLAVAAT